MITEILEFLNETGTYTTARRVKRGLEDIPQKSSINALDYGQKLSFISKLDLVEKRDTQPIKWRITDRGQKWLEDEIDLRDL